MRLNGWQGHVGARVWARAAARWIGKATGAVLILLVRVYQFGISPLLIGTCKFVPSCSQYFVEAVGRYGPVRGGYMGVRRVLRCHPFGGGGIDPVP